MLINQFECKCAFNTKILTSTIRIRHFFHVIMQTLTQMWLRIFASRTISWDARYNLSDHTEKISKRAITSKTVRMRCLWFQPKYGLALCLWNDKGHEIREREKINGFLNSYFDNNSLTLCLSTKEMSARTTMKWMKAKYTGGSIKSQLRNVLNAGNVWHTRNRIDGFQSMWCQMHIGCIAHEHGT